MPRGSAAWRNVLRKLREILGLLETMADKGLVMDMPYAGTTYYLLMPGLIGFFEFTFMKHRADLPMARLAVLMREYLDESQGKEFFGSAAHFAERPFVTSRIKKQLRRAFTLGRG